MTNETKQCTKCGEEKPATVEYFHKNGNRRLRSYCKICIAKRKKEWYEANKEHCVKKSKAYYEANKEAMIQYRKSHYRTPRGKWHEIKMKAKQRNINFSLPFELYESQLWGKPCHYCGCDIETTGLDRKDNGKGYAADNVVPCCRICNTKKNTKPYQDFMAEIKKSTGVNNELKVL